MGRYKEHSIGFGGAGSHITIFGMPDYAGDIDNLIASGRTAGKVKKPASLRAFSASL
mgnify:CR=1 FL=1